MNRNKRTYLRKILQLITIITIVSFIIMPALNTTKTIVQSTRQISQSTYSLRSDWWDYDWLYRKQININHTITPNNLTDFPLLISIIDSDLAIKAQIDGDDIVFTDQQQQQLNHEIEYYKSNNGTLITWIQIPLLNSTENTILYMYYGNQNSGNQQHIPETWDNQFLAIHHLEEQTDIINDSTSNNNHGTAYGNITLNNEGKINGAIFFDGIDDYILLPQIYTTDTQFTMEAWIYPQTDARYILSQRNSTTNGAFIQIAQGGNYLQYYINNQSDGTSGIPWNTWHYIALTYNGTTAKLFLNNETPKIKTCNPPVWPTENLYIGDRSLGFRQFHGIIDEVRLSNVARDESWITASYNNQQNTSNYYVLGDEESIPNNPPNKPDEPQPIHNATNIPINTTLSVHVIDIDNDTMNVFFYDASDHSLIDVDVNVENGSRAEIMWTNLDYETIYSWYAIANDSVFETISDTWSFTTESQQTTPPTISIIKPEEKSLYFRDRRILSFPKTLILGYITVIADAVDDEGIKEVRFFIDGTLHHIAVQPDDYGYYSWTYNERSWIRGRHTITVVAVDITDQEAEDSITVTIRNFPLLHPLRP